MCASKPNHVLTLTAGFNAFREARMSRALKVMRGTRAHLLSTEAEGKDGSIAAREVGLGCMNCTHFEKCKVVLFGVGRKGILLVGWSLTNMVHMVSYILPKNNFLTKCIDFIPASPLNL